MAEEKEEGLEGLDDFEDDFGEQLDSFMESDGEEESDSELDSFFEDLSTIDDLDGDDKESTNQKSNDEVKNDSTEAKKTKDKEQEENLTNDDEIVDKDSNKKKNRFPLKAVIFSCITGLFLGISTLAVIYFSSNSTEIKKPEIVLKKPESKTIAKKIKNTPKEKPKIKVIKKKKKKKKPKPIPKKITYNIQVASCISFECMDESRIILKNMGYETKVTSTSENSGIAEVLSSDILSEENSVKIVNKINNNNPVAGYAFRKSLKSGYNVSLGYFPDLETANRVRTYLNQAFKEEIYFKIKRSTQKINFQVIEVGGLKTKKDAELLINKLKKKNRNFESAFVKSVTKH